VIWEIVQRFAVAASAVYKPGMEPGAIGMIFGKLLGSFYGA